MDSQYLDQMPGDSQPLVSILIPVYNREKLIGECIQSALDSNYSNFEVIICDNCSTDRTVQVVEELAKQDTRIKLFKNSENIGPVYNWLECAKHANGIYIKILFSDDQVHASFLDKSVKYLSDPKIGFVYSSVRIFGARDEILYGRGEHPINNLSSMTFVEGFFGLNKPTPVSPGCTLMRKNDFFEFLKTQFEHSTFTDYASHGAGTDIGILHGICYKYPNLIHLEECLNSFRDHNDSITTSRNDDVVYTRTISAALSLAKSNCSKLLFRKILSFFYTQKTDFHVSPSDFLKNNGYSGPRENLITFSYYYSKIRRKLIKIFSPV